MQSTQLFSPISANMTSLLKQLQKPIIVDQFNTGTTEILLILTETHLVICQNVFAQLPTHFLKLDFSVKSEFLFATIPSNNDEPQIQLKNPTAFVLQRQNCEQKVTLYSANTNILEKWLVELEKKINQRNFHKLFKAKKKIGKGAFATVYLAERLRDKQMVAVKAFSKEKQYSGDKGRQSLENQVRLMRNIHCSNVMRLEGVYQTQNSIYVILEYLEGVQLNEVLKTGKLLSSQGQMQVIKNILRGLQYLSANRIIHRDLKPENIMFRKQKSYEAVICDFGLATFADAAKYLFVRCGTPGFVAPEIINIKDMSTKSEPISDVFSAGLIFHYLLFGCSIFPGKKYNEILNQNRSSQFDFSLQRYKGMNPLAFDLLTRMLEKNPSKRISAQTALNHAYFTNSIQIEQTTKRLHFQDLSNYSPSIASQVKSSISNNETSSMMNGNSNRSSFALSNISHFR